MNGIKSAKQPAVPGPRSETRKKVTVDDIGRIGLVAWAFYYFFPQFTANTLLGVHGVSFAYTGFYWLANGFIFAIILLVAWKYHHPLAQMAIFPVFAYVGYASTRLFIDEYIALNPGIVIFSGVVTALAILNLVLVIKNMVRSFARKEWLPKMRTLKSSKVFKIAGLCSLAWFGMVSWSYFGFSQTYTVVDPGQANFSFAFWGSPSAGTNISHYSTPEGIAEMQRYQQLNASFYNTINVNTLSNNATLAIYEAMLNEWEPYNVSIIYDLTPLYWNGTDWVGDYVSYHYVDEVNETLQMLMDWLEPLNLPNFRGISLDIEGPKDEQNRSRELYETALEDFQSLLDEFKARFPNCTTQMIQMDGIIFDFYDGDHDLDVAQRTVSTALDWDYYGFMTYHVGASPTSSSYRYAYYLENGVEQWGTRFQPWVGWWDNEKPGETPQIDLPGVYEMSLEHVKIAKSFGVDEVVLAPVRNFIGRDHDQTKIIERLDDLVAIKNGFETFTIPITNNMRLFNDWDLYWEKIVPDYVQANSGVAKDLFLGTPNNWFLWVQVIQCIVIVLAGVIIKARNR